MTAETSRPVLALLPWGHVIEDFLVPNKLSIDAFCNEFTGSWMFGYAAALQTVGVETVIFCISGTTAHTIRRTHRPTGAQICLIPAPRAYRLLRSTMRTGYARTAEQAFALPRAARLALLPFLEAVNEAAAYLSTPVRELTRQVQRDGCSSLLCQEYEFPRFDVCVFARPVHRLPVFATFQGGDYRRWRLERLLRPLSMRRADGVIVASDTEVERLMSTYGLPQDKIARIPNPVDLDSWRPHDRADARRFLSIPDETLVAAWHGRVQIRKKGLDVLLDAWRDLSRVDLGRRTTLLLIGDGEDAPQLRARIAALGLENVVWLDRHMHEPSAIARTLAAADVYVFPSRHEGFALAPVEAMACGLPVVAAAASGVGELLVGGESSGGVVVPRDDPRLLALELARLLGDETLRRRMGHAARRRAQTFGLSAVGARLRAFLFEAGADDDPEAAPRARPLMPIQ